MTRLFDLVHHALLLVVVGWRPLIACALLVGGTADIDTVYWRFLPAVGLLFCLLETIAGRRRRWRWGGAGVLAVLLLFACIPAILASPVPALAINQWLEWASLLATAAYLMQVLPGRRRFVFALLVAALAAHCGLAAMQHLAVQPRMLALHTGGELLDPARAGDPDFTAAIAERLRNGGVYSTFTLANGLAVMLCLLGIPLLGVLWESHARPRPVALGPILLLTVAVWIYWLTGAKGALLALLGAAGWLACARLPTWLSWSLRGGGVAGAVALFVLAPTWLGASFAVRHGYATAAWGLIAEAPLTGHGWKAFMVEGASHLPLGREFSRHAHNAVLEIAVSAGLPIAILLAALLATWMYRPRHLRGPEPSPARPRRLGYLLLAAYPLLLLYALAFGSLASDNLAYWPGVAQHPGLEFVWTLLLGLPASLAGICAYRLGPPPTWSLLIAVGCFCLASLIDFHLREGALVGTAMILACLATAHRVPNGYDFLATAAGLVLLLTCIGAQIWHLDIWLERRGLRRRLAVMQLARSGKPEDRQQAWVLLADLDPGTSAEDLRGSPRLRGPLYERILRQGYTLATAWPTDTGLWQRCLALDGDVRRRRRQVERMIDAGLDDNQVLELAADLDQERGAHAIALQRSRRAVARHPGNMQLRFRHLQRLERALPAVDPATRTDLRNEIARHRAFIRRNNHRAHFRVRLRSELVPEAE